ncbi:UDP-4-amino-4,6-dideoxy-N-acetyl-beta-L-altrosamine transaminase [Ponticoccus alexandrii]|uniref:UDP-4-amino-4, 6-dideoxy-N-acetyl-beta-L-altrosamine transaminase n=1 Tax=Ponticoccus alexandrii TaxID=1943633 RepID=A0ABX7FFB8_9RHOB|nr:UDP-4-amino-4,6-dideoxy-N-acetyl-beta-L-altrosamine transaminase [Ponticoccus alexandrii]ETA50654.1 flagellin modification protein FlmB [Rhodobacteraceae bacterium PD-2]QRF68626.1 UDP-4-amino-4,6-dideoxy-N-acetyl-beta-L-altrosamine transaminase [Ponticoccus alexandrii]
MLAYGRQSIAQDDIDEVVRVLRGDFLTTGPEVPKFEEAFCAYTGAPHALACANGTAALHMIAMAMDLKPGDQVIVPSISFVATANGPHYCGAEVIFADVDAETGLMTPHALKEAMARADKSRLRAVFVVHLNGSRVDLEAIAKLTKEAGVALVEDACHALGSTYPVGNGTGNVGDCALSDFCAFSFHPVKTITSGEGGMVTCRDPEMAARLALLRNHGLERDKDLFTDPEIGFEVGTGEHNPWAYELQMLGYNYRLTDFQAALGRSQLAKMSRFGPQRKALVAAYRRKLAPLAHLVTPALNTDNEDAVLHLMVGRIDFAARGKTRRQVMAQLRELGVGTQVHYIPIHRQPYYAKLNPGLNLPGAEAYYAGCLSLPLYPDMTEADVDTVVRALATVLGD